MQIEELERYQKQISIDQIGIEGQRRLKNGRLLVVGAGGLGCPALTQLVGAGIGQIGVVDGDDVELSNLPRQSLFNDSNIGNNKAVVAAQQLHLMNPHVSVVAYPCFLNSANVHELLADYDIVIDATDRPAPRYEISKYCGNQSKAHIYGAVDGMSGQITVFNVYDEKDQTYSYVDLFPEPSPNACRCSEAGILGMIPNSIGTLQAVEAIKLLLGQRSPLQSKLLTINYESYQQKIIALSSNPRSSRGYQLNSLPLAPPLISCQELDQLLLSSTPPLLIDVRDKTEAKEKHLGGLWIPLHTLAEQVPPLPTDRLVIVYCQTGRRSVLAANTLKEMFPEANIRCLEG
ncbi:HesA/MoeB/ThiF family protein, partial [Simkania negevensis]|nr:HesA/MoeB/ThiF family protein [Simkania negevensis]